MSQVPSLEALKRSEKFLALDPHDQRATMDRYVERYVAPRYDAQTTEAVRERVYAYKPDRTLGDVGRDLAGTAAKTATAMGQGIYGIADLASEVAGRVIGVNQAMLNFYTTGDVSKSIDIYRNRVDRGGLDDMTRDMEWLGKPKGVSINDLMSQQRQAIDEKLSPKTRLKLQEQGQIGEGAESFTEQARGFADSIGYLASNPDLLGMQATESLGQMLFSGGIGKEVGDKVLKEALEAAMKNGGKEAVEKALPLAKKKALAAASAATLATEGAMEGSLAGAEAAQRVMGLPDATLAKSPEFQRLSAQYGPEKARSVLANMASDRASGMAAAISFASNKLTGAAGKQAEVFSKLPFSTDSIVADVLKIGGTATAEGAQEALQEGGAQASSNLGVQVADPGQSIWDGVGPAAGAGVALGSAVGGGIAGGRVAADRFSGNRGAVERVAPGGNGPDVNNQQDAAPPPPPDGQTVERNAAGEVVPAGSNPSPIINADDAAAEQELFEGEDPDAKAETRPSEYRPDQAGDVAPDAQAGLDQPAPEVAGSEGDGEGPAPDEPPPPDAETATTDVTSAADQESAVSVEADETPELTPEEQENERKRFERRKAQSERQKKRLQLDPKNDSFDISVRKLGGLNTEVETDWQGRLSHLNANDRRPGLYGIEQKGRGLTLDDLAEWAHENGYIPENDQTLVAELLEKVENGMKVYRPDSPRWQEELDAREREREEADMQREAAEFGEETGGADPFEMGDFMVESGFEDVDPVVTELVAQAEDIDAGAVEAAAVQFESDSEGFENAIRQIIAGKGQADDPATGAPPVLGKKGSGGSASLEGVESQEAPASQPAEPERAPRQVQQQDDGGFKLAQQSAPKRQAKPQQGGNTGDMFGRNETAQGIHNAKLAKDAQRNGSQDVDPGIDGGLFSSQSKQVDIEAAANQAATSPANDKPEPSQAQKEAGNYAMGHIRVHGMDISIENPKGSKRAGTDRDGKAWEQELKDHYGYIKGTTGKDKDHLDVFIGPKPDESKFVYVVDQVDPQTGQFDEHKIMLGYPNQGAARQGYNRNYAKGWKGLGKITKATVDEFKQWLKGDTTKPFADRKASAPEPRKISVGGSLSEGQTATTASGRTTTPFPRIDIGSERKAQNTVKRVNEWLVGNALAEAESRGDDFNATQFRAIDSRNISQSDKDSAELYLFGDEQPPVLPSILEDPSTAGAQEKSRNKPRPDDTDRLTRSNRGAAETDDKSAAKINLDAITTGDELRFAIEATPNTVKPTTRTEDWGSNRGHGKRSGGMVAGAMSAAPQGKKTYTNVVGSLPEAEANEVNQTWDGRPPAEYMKARSGGLDHDQAMLVGYAARDPDYTWDQALARLKGEGAPDAGPKPDDPRIQYTRAAKDTAPRIDASAYRQDDTLAQDGEALARLARALETAHGRPVPVHPVRLGGSKSAEEAKRLRRAYRDIFGRRVVYFASGHKLAPEGVFLDGDTLFVNIQATRDDAPSPIAFVAAHEFLHSLEANDPALYEEFKRAALALAKNTGEYGDMIRAQYDRDELKITDADIEREFLADGFAAFFSNPGALDALEAKMRPNAVMRFFGRLAAFLKGLAARLRGIKPQKHGERYFAHVDAMRRIVVSTAEMAAQRSIQPTVYRKNDESLVARALDEIRQWTQTDLYDDLPTQAGADDAGARKRAQAGQGAVSTQAQKAELRATGQRKLGRKKISSLEDAAASTLYIQNQAVERFEAIVTDKDGKPLAVVGTFKGTVDAASVYPRVVLQETMGIDGAANLWFTHNHPSGESSLSRADIHITNKIAEAFEGTRVRVRGITAIAGGADGRAEFSAYEAGHGGRVSGTVERGSGVTVPVIERVITESAGSDRIVIDTPDRASERIRDKYGDSVGILLLDSRHREVGFVPWAPSKADTLKDTGNLDDLYDAVFSANPSAAIIVNTGQVYSKRRYLSLGGALRAAEVRVLDVVDTAPDAEHRSLADRGHTLDGPIFNRATGPEPVFYSQLERVIEAKMGNKEPAKGLAMKLRGWEKKGDFKPDELEWSGLIPWLEEQSGKVAKGDVLAYLDANRVRVSEVLLAGEDRVDDIYVRELDTEYHEMSGNRRITYEEDATGITFVFSIDEDDGSVELVDAYGGPMVPDITDFSVEDLTGVSPGRQDERTAVEAIQEWAVNKLSSFNVDERSEGNVEHPEQTLDGGENYRELLLTLPKRTAEVATPYVMNYRSSHYDTPNIIAHTRFNERTVDGKRTLFVEEIQSDWHQQGRSEGYGEPIWGVFNDQGVLDMTAPTKAEAIALAKKSGYPDSAVRESGQTKGVPDAPFKSSKDWSMLAMRRLIRWAAENGFEQIAWTSGAMQADRYDLSKQIQAIRWALYADDQVDIEMKPWKMGGDFERAGRFAIADLPGVMGKELADKVAAAVNAGEVNGEFEGVDLKVGGEGMKGFYDKILPNAVNRYVKKFGARVGRGEVNGEPVHTLPVTDRMRETAMQGQPLFSRKVRLSGIDVAMFSRLVDGESGKFSALQQSIRERLDLPFDIPVEFDSSISEPMAFDAVSGRVFVNKSVPQTKETAAGNLIEEYLHAIDVSKKSRSVSASSPRFQPGGDILEAAKSVTEPFLKEHLRYPLEETGMTQARMAAELFARLGAVYHGNPDLLADQIPAAMEIYDGIRQDFEQLQQVQPTVRGRAGQVVDADPGRGKAAGSRDGDEQGGADWRADQRLVEFRRAIARRTGGNLLGRSVPPMLKVTPPSGGVTRSGPLFSRRQLDDKTKEAMRKAGTLDAELPVRERLARGVGVIWEDFKDLMGSFHQGMFDQFRPIKNSEGNIDPERSGYIAARLSTGASSVMYGAMLYGTPEFKGGMIRKKAGTKGLTNILKPVQDDLNDWISWMVAKRAEYLASEEGGYRENNLTLEDVARLKALAGDKEALFEQVATEFREFNVAMLELARDTGLLSKDQVEAFQKDQYYVPFYRVDEGSDGDVMRPFTNRGLSHQSAGIRQLKGGAQALNDPLENVFANMSRLIDASMKNYALYRTLMSNPGIATRVSMKRNAGGRGDKVVQVMHRGKPYKFEVQDPAMLRALTAIGEKPRDGVAMNFGRFTKRLLTTGVTAEPTFMLRNFIRDMMHAWTIDKNGFRLALDSVKGAKSTLATMRELAQTDPDKADPVVVSMMFAGSSFLGGYTYGTDPTKNAAALRRSLRRKGLGKNAVDKYMGSLTSTPAEFWARYRDFGDAIENANRVAVAKAALTAGKTELEAAFEAKDLMDYSLRGRWAAIQVMADVLPFFNARVQGLYKLGREMAREGTADDPRMLRIAKNLTGQLAQKGMMIAMASLVLAMLNEDEDEYQALEDWDKDANWHLFVGDLHFRIPKPFELGIIFGTVPERMFQLGAGNDDLDDTKKSAVHAITSTLAINPIPQALRPGAEVFFNWDMFRERPIEGMADQGKLPEDRFGSFTSPTMVAIGQATGYSPRKLEHLWNGYLGTLGSYALAMPDSMIHWATPGEQPARKIDDYPVIGSFVKQGTARSTRYGTEMYELSREAEQLYRSLNDRAENGRDIDELRNDPDNLQLLMGRDTLRYGRQATRELRKQMDQIRADEGMGAKAKRDQIEDLQARINAIQKQTVEMVEGQ